MSIKLCMEHIFLIMDLSGCIKSRFYKLKHLLCSHLFCQRHCFFDGRDGRHLMDSFLLTLQWPRVDPCGWNQHTFAQEVFLQMVAVFGGPVEITAWFLLGIAHFSLPSLRHCLHSLQLKKIRCSLICVCVGKILLYTGVKSYSVHLLIMLETKRQNTQGTHQGFSKVFLRLRNCK